MAQPAHASQSRFTSEAVSAPIATAISDLEEFVVARRRKRGAVSDMLEFEKRLHAKLMGLGREIVKEELEGADIDVPAIVTEGTVYRACFGRRRTTRQPRARFGSCARCTRTVRMSLQRAVVPMELRLGLIEGRRAAGWPPLGAAGP